jgi:hypothetical protein
VKISGFFNLTKLVCWYITLIQISSTNYSIGTTLALE